MKRMHYPCPSCGKAIKISVSDMAKGYSERLEYMICPYCREEIPFPIRTEPALDFPAWAPDQIKEPTPLNAFDAVIGSWSSVAVLLAAAGFFLYGFNGIASGRPVLPMLLCFAASAVFGLLTYFNWDRTYKEMQEEYEERKEQYQNSLERLSIGEYSKALRKLDIDVPASLAEYEPESEGSEEE